MKRLLILTILCLFMLVGCSEEESAILEDYESEEENYSEEVEKQQEDEGIESIYIETKGLGIDYADYVNNLVSLDYLYEDCFPEIVVELLNIDDIEERIEDNTLVRTAGYMHEENEVVYVSVQYYDDGELESVRLGVASKDFKKIGSFISLGIAAESALKSSILSDPNELSIVEASEFVFEEGHGIAIKNGIESICIFDMYSEHGELYLTLKSE